MIKSFENFYLNILIVYTFERKYWKKKSVNYAQLLTDFPSLYFRVIEKLVYKRLTRYLENCKIFE